MFATNTKTITHYLRMTDNENETITLKLTQEADEWAAYGIQMLKLPGYAKYDGVNEE